MRPSFFHLAGALILCIASFVGYGAWYATLSAKSAAVADLQSRIDAKTETMDRITTARAALAGIANDEALVRGYFVPETEVVSFIDALEAQGEALGTDVRVLSVSTGGAPASPTLSLSLTVGGTFDAVMRTVGSIEYAPYAITVVALSVTQDVNDGWQADLKLSVGSVPAPRAETAAPASSVRVSFI